jgi:hypothetical protein
MLYERPVRRSIDSSAAQPNTRPLPQRTAAPSLPAREWPGLMTVFVHTQFRRQGTGLRQWGLRTTRLDEPRPLQSAPPLRCTTAWGLDPTTDRDHERMVSEYYCPHRMMDGNSTHVGFCSHHCGGKKARPRRAAFVRGVSSWCVGTVCVEAVGPTGLPRPRFLTPLARMPARFRRQIDTRLYPISS